MSAGQDEKARSSFNPLLWILLLPLAGAATWGLWVLVSQKQDETPAGASSAFNLSEAPKPDGRSPLQASNPASYAQDGMAKPGGGPGLAGFVQETSGIFVKQTKGAPADSAREQEFVKQYGAAVSKYQQQVLGPLTEKYWKNYPIVRQVDREFTKLDRYMALSDQYGRDHDGFKWARGVIALPEVRRTLMKYSLNPEVWKVGIQMSLEALKNPPPKPIYDETQRFLTADKEMSTFVGDFATQIVPNMGKMVLQAVPPGTDLRPLQGLASQLAPENLQQSMTSQPLAPAPPKTPRR